MFENPSAYPTQFDIQNLHNYNLANKIELNLSNHQLRIQELELLKDFMIKASNLKKLDLSNNLLTSQACEKLAFILSHFKQLEYLDLSNNAIRDAGLNLLVPVLSQLDNLKVLKLNHCRLINIKNLSKHLGKISQLELSKNQIEIGLGEISSDHLTTLIIQENHNQHRRQSLSLSEIKKIIMNNKNLTFFSLGNNQFNKEEIMALQKSYASIQFFIKNETPKGSIDLPKINEPSLKMR